MIGNRDAPFAESSCPSSREISGKCATQARYQNRMRKFTRMRNAARLQLIRASSQNFQRECSNDHREVFDNRLKEE